MGAWRGGTPTGWMGKGYRVVTRGVAIGVIVVQGWVSTGRYRVIEVQVGMYGDAGVGGGPGWVGKGVVKFQGGWVWGGGEPDGWTDE